jgi:tungstate transport system substrate-binding protein
MQNEFVIVGPASDPAGARGLEAVAALRMIAAAGATFVSRGDDSGTHHKELSLWRRADLSPQEAPWYVDVGQGMAETLGVAAERGAYTLTDRATYLSLAQAGSLQVVVDHDTALHNPYSVIVATRARNRNGARAFANWISSRTAQRLIGNHGRAEFGRALFTPAAHGSPGRSRASRADAPRD